MTLARIKMAVVIIQNILLVVLVEFSLRIIGIKRTWKILERCLIKKRISHDDDQELKNSLAGLANAMKRSPFKGKCLARSLVLWWQLKRRGISSTLHIGVQSRKIMRAHAWVQYGDRILNAGPNVHSRYRAMAQFNNPKELG
ncbi:hypothetical protein GCM10007939_04270 [Amylibacter marinus]|uniref:Microcin J25-processing protein McjB C-terminal domain-containing protein n=1 Tax=Amylibacter marinus TaxID=1475483 RepID=A0ABQ5VSL6_9RHOB|nr:lasso peptide biosynthesis B2 protein [Amylibacter marinus]GLQ34144.1 hypothetical protein GCM10007939_04270 [Amylibacter marinus]